LTGLTVAVPNSFARVGSLLSAMLMGSVALVTDIPEAVSIVTWTAGAMAAPALAAVGCVVKTRRAGGSVGV
jgi:hypothetical protein